MALGSGDRRGPAGRTAGHGQAVNLQHVAAAIRDRLEALGPFARAELLRVLLLPDYDRAGTIGEYHQDARTRNFAELLIDAEEGQVHPGCLVGMLWEADP